MAVGDLDQDRDGPCQPVFKDGLGGGILVSAYKHGDPGRVIFLLGGARDLLSLLRLWILGIRDKP